MRKEKYDHQAASLSYQNNRQQRHKKRLRLAVCFFPFGCRCPSSPSSSFIAALCCPRRKKKKITKKTTVMTNNQARERRSPCRALSFAWFLRFVFFSFFLSLSPSLTSPAPTRRQKALHTATKNEERKKEKTPSKQAEDKAHSLRRGRLFH